MTINKKRNVSVRMDDNLYKIIAVSAINNDRSLSSQCYNMLKKMAEIDQKNQQEKQNVSRKY